MRGTVQKYDFCREIFSGEVTLGVARVENSWISLIEKSGVLSEFRAHGTTWARAICDAKHLGNEFGMVIENQVQNKQLGLQIHGLADRLEIWHANTDACTRPGGTKTPPSTATAL